MAIVNDKNSLFTRRRVLGAALTSGIWRFVVLILTELELHCKSAVRNYRKLAVIFASINCLGGLAVKPRLRRTLAVRFDAVITHPQGMNRASRLTSS